MIRFTLGSVILTVCLSSTAVFGDVVHYLKHSPESLAAFSLAIDQAQHSIDIATYIFEPCDSSVQVLMDKLIARAKAGVKVRILLDGLRQPQKQRRNLARQFARYGIKLRTYSNFLFNINLRLHSKFMVIDNQFYIAGGRNFADNYFALSRGYNYLDRDVLVEGASAWQATQSFNQLWNSKLSLKQKGDPKMAVAWKKFCPRSFTAGKKKVSDYLNRNASNIMNSIPSRRCDDVQFINDDPHFANLKYGPAWQGEKNAASFMTPQRLHKKRATSEVLNFIRQTRSHLYFENWIYLPILDLQAALTNVRDRSIPINVLSNQDLDEGPKWFQEAVEYAIEKIANEDTEGSQWVGLVSSKRSLNDNFELSPNRAPTYIHSKAAVRDGKDVLVGSFNLDSRSANINLESVVSVMNCADLAMDVKAGYDELQAMYDADIGHIPPKKPASAFAKFMARLLLYEL